MYIKKLFIILLLITIFFSSTGEAGTEEVKLTIVHTNDLHSMIMPFSEEDEEKVGGFARIAALLKRIRNENENVLFLDAGDLLAGSENRYQVDYSLPLFGYRGLLEFELMNQLELDAMVLGNHEFDFGVRWLERLFEEAKFEILSANSFHRPLPDVEGRNGEAIVNPYAFFVFNGVKVAVIGLTTYIYIKSSQVLVEFPFDAEILSKELPHLKENADLIVVLSHLGIENDRKLAREVDGIDIIVGGHSHTETPEPVREGKTLIVQAGKYGKKLGKMEIVMEDGEIVSYDYRLIPVDGKIEPDKKVQQLIRNKEFIGEIFGNSLVSSDQEQSTLGRFTTDAMCWFTGADVALINSGLVEGELKKGIIRADDFFEVFWPYRVRTVGPEKDLNEKQLIEMVKKQREDRSLPLWSIIGKSDGLESVVLLELTGEELLEVINRSNEQVGTDNYLQISGIDLELKEIYYNLISEEKYKVAVNLSLALGKGGYEQLWKPEDFKVLNKEVFEVVLEYFEYFRSLFIKSPGMLSFQISSYSKSLFFLGWPNERKNYSQSRKTY